MTNNNVVKDEKDVAHQIYEVGYHIVSSIPEEGVGARVAQVHDVIEKAGGTIISEEFPKTVELAYEMVKVADNQRKSYTSAYFGWVKFEGPGSSVEVVKKALDGDREILRFIVIKTVRENTLIPKKVAMQAGRKEEDIAAERAERREKEDKEKAVMTEEELNKTIDDLAPVETAKVDLTK